MPTEVESSRKPRTVLYQTESFEITSIDWTNPGDTGTVVAASHNHGWSQCMVLIEQGSFENRLELGFKTEVRVLEVGEVIDTPVGAHHEMRCLSRTGTTLHVYTPQIKEHTEKGIFKVSSLTELKNQVQLNEAVSISRLGEILKTVREHSVSTHSPFFMNQLFTGVLPQMLIAEDFIAQTKTTLATYEASPALSTIEAEVVERLAEQIGWPVGERDGVCVPGGSAANFMALHLARHKKYPEAKTAGMKESVKIYVSAEAHYSFKKACAALGLGTDHLVAVPVDGRGRMKPVDLDQLIGGFQKQGASPLLVCATAGTTVLGAFDPIAELSNVCKKHNVWLHVDAAWGGPALFSKSMRHHVDGIEHADSVTFDAHKLFGASLTCSFLLTKYPGLLLAANDVSGAEYLFHEETTIDRGRLSWQCGRKADAMSFWTIWKNVGTAGLGAVVDRFCDIRDQTMKWVADHPRLEVIAQPEYLNICLRVSPPPQHSGDSDWSRKVREVLKERNLAMVNYSSNAEGSFLRLILAHPFLRPDHVQQILKWALEVE